MPRIKLRHGIINPKRNDIQDKQSKGTQQDKKKCQAQDAVKKGAAVLQKR